MALVYQKEKRQWLLRSSIGVVAAAQLVVRLPSMLKPLSQSPALPKDHMVAHICSLSILGVETEGSEIQGHPSWLQSEFKVRLKNMTPCKNSCSYYPLQNMLRSYPSRECESRYQLKRGEMKEEGVSKSVRRDSSYHLNGPSNC